MTTRPTSIMIVESQPMMRTALSTAISAEGMNVVAEVTDSRDALQAASRLTPDLILFSINQPSLTEMDRLSVLRQKLPGTLIIALVTGEFRGQFQMALDHGAHLVLAKYTQRSELLTAIKRMTGLLLPLS